MASPMTLPLPRSTTISISPAVCRRSSSACQRRRSSPCAKGCISSAGNDTIVIFEELMDSKSLWLTPNTDSIYFATWLDLHDGPLVMETPPNVLGFIDDFWFDYVGDFGNAG